MRSETILQPPHELISMLEPTSKILIVRFALISVVSICLLGCGTETNQMSLDDTLEDTVTSDDTFKTLPGSDDNEAATKVLKRLRDSFEKDFDQLKQEIAATEVKDEKVRIFNEQNPLPNYLIELTSLAKKYSRTETAVSAALEVVSRSENEAKNEAMIFLIENFAPKLQYAKMIKSFQEDVPSLDIENWILKMIQHAPDAKTRATTIIGYSRYVDQIPAYQEGFSNNPHLLAKLPVAQQQYMAAKRTNEQKAQHVKLLESVIDGGDLNNNRFEDGRSYGETARRELFELKFLQVGQVAPDVKGKDLDGIEFKLSDYRGKIVMLDFWGHWCPPCRAMYSHEQELVSNLATVPFVLLGVNSDSTVKSARRAVRNEGLSWRHFVNGPRGTDGSISEQWNVNTWPTIYLIDGDGVIRYKDVFEEHLDRALEQLLAEQGHMVDLTLVR